MDLALFAPLGLTLVVLLGLFGWFLPRFTAGVLLTVGAFLVALFATVELDGAGLSESYAYVAGYALAQPLFAVLMTLPGRFEAREYWQVDRVPSIALDMVLVVGVGAAFGAAAVVTLSELALLAGDRGTAALGVVSAGALLTFTLRTRRFKRDTADRQLTSVSL